jgi:hypothetical protein
MDDIKRINLWSGPRNVSTAVMYAFRERSDTSVVDEPLYAHYLCRTGVEHPALQDVIRSQDTDGESVVRTLLLGPAETPVRFFKHMAHHLIELDTSFLGQMENLLLTRDPRQMLPSLVNQVPNPTVEGTSLPMQIRMLDRILESGGSPIVIESKGLLLDPEGVLTTVCERLGLEWDPGMLSWDEGPKPEDGVWAPHWYDNVHSSTGFAPYREKDEPFPARLQPLLAECMPLFERLREHAI